MIYKHFKGGEYRLLFEARDASSHGDEEKDTMMVYVSLGCGRSEPGTIWIRPQREWNENVKWPDGVTRPRFVLVGQQRRPL